MNEKDINILKENIFLIPPLEKISFLILQANKEACCAGLCCAMSCGKQGDFFFHCSMNMINLTTPLLPHHLSQPYSLVTVLFSNFYHAKVCSSCFT